MEVRWLPSAVRDLAQARAYIARENPAAAERLFERVLGEVGALSVLPHIGRPGRVRNTRELVVRSTPFIVAYRVHGSRVIILATIHAARQWPDRL